MTGTPQQSARVGRNLLWNLLGLTGYNLGQWLLLVVLARATGAQAVGTFALALAIASPVYLAVGLNLRIVRATDVERSWRAGQYSRLRLLLNAVSLAVTLAVGLVVGMSGEALVVLLLVALSKAVEATSHVLYGFFTLRERLDFVSRSLLARAFAGCAAFALLAFTTHSLVWAVLGLSIGWSAVYLLHDAPAQRRLLGDDTQVIEAHGLDSRSSHRSTRALAVTSLPLGVDAGLGSLATNLPRYAVQAGYGTAALAVFASLAYLAQLISFVTGALGDAVLGRLALLHRKDDRRGMWRLVLLVVGFGVGVTLVALVGAAVAGRWFIGVAMGREYVDQSVLLILLAGAGLVTIQRSLARILHAGQRFGQALLIDSVVCAAALAYSALLVPRWGLDGAAAVLGLAFMTGTVVTLLVFSYNRRERHLAEELRV